jgi:predicted dehydrogenase
MKQHTIGIIMNGVTGRMGTNQHLLRSIAEIIKQGGVKIAPGETIMPDPILIGRDENKLRKLCYLSGISKMSTDLDEILKNTAFSIYFDAQTTGRRADAVRKAIKAGKHIYCEKPVAVSTKVAMELFEMCTKAVKFFLYGENSDTGFSREIQFRRNDHRGITGRRMMAGSSQTCSATGATFWITFLEK